MLECGLTKSLESIAQRPAQKSSAYSCTCCFNMSCWPSVHLHLRACLVFLDLQTVQPIGQLIPQCSINLRILSQQANSIAQPVLDKSAGADSDCS
ncbi:hypothetical protein KC19_4G094300 [Ceratodon purpureus]|uniref:Uncharacterized protein n=1 Tax=Ceratodon purpureus TaxID=3225 RepID=A0A8T0I8U1_CERPU|nr:hypothetical protein KC19_4G094100 [Ceratodon purpureus]KAG0579379.1 hypothetical protein KC19_4G094300 [Ceratodon purpureus]